MDLAQRSGHGEIDEGIATGLRVTHACLQLVGLGRLGVQVGSLSQAIAFNHTDKPNFTRPFQGQGESHGALTAALSNACWSLLAHIGAVRLEVTQDRRNNGIRPDLLDQFILRRMNPALQRLES